MFKLIKILNAGRNVPEPQRLPVTSGASYKIGCALVLSSGKLAHCSATTAPTYIAAQSLASGAGSTLLAYPVTPGMIFETTFSAAPTSIVAGNKLTLTVDSASNAVGVTATTTSGVATVYDMRGAAAAGDAVEVRFS